MSSAIVVEIKGTKIHIEKLLSVDENDLSGEFTHQAAQYGRFAVMTAEAEASYMLAKKETEREYAAVDSDVRAEAVELGKKMTEGAVKAQITIDEAYIAAQDWEGARLSDFKAMRALTDAMKMRADMLISLGAHNRAEMGMTGMSISDKNEELVARYKKSSKK